jgi:electron transport complex protein RnfC
MKLPPTRIANFVEARMFAEAADIGLTDCIECGSCAYMCPAGIPLVQIFQYGKAEYWILKRKEESKKKEAEKDE